MSAAQAALVALALELLRGGGELCDDVGKLQVAVDQGEMGPFDTATCEN